MKTTTLHYTNARLLAVQAVYAQNFSDAGWDKIISSFLLGDMGGFVLQDDVLGRESYVELESADAQLFTHLVTEIKDKKTDIYSMIETNMPEHIDFNKMELLLKSILAVGVAEFYVNPDLPSPIIINEYVDMTRSFFNDGESKIVNAFLDKFAKIIRS